MTPTLPLLLPALLIAGIAGLVAWQAWQAQQRIIQARGWRQTSGVVVHSGVAEHQVRQPRKSGNRYRLVTRYAPRIVYQYMVDQAPYQSERLTLGVMLLHSEYKDAARIAARYPQGAVVTVFYNAANPADAVIEPRAAGGVLMIWLMAIGLLAIAAYIASLALAP